MTVDDYCCHGNGGWSGTVVIVDECCCGNGDGKGM